jgi:hypothetical protein
LQARWLPREGDQGRLAVTGGSAMGSLVGVGGDLVGRYGVKGGKWDEVSAGRKGQAGRQGRACH